jgi:hypothetical protein
MSAGPTWKERMAIALARDIVDGERVISGAHTEISFAAAMLAQKMHAPNRFSVRIPARTCTWLIVPASLHSM